MSQVQPASKTLMSYTEVRKLFSAGRLKLRRQKAMTGKKVRAQQATMKSRH
ncbi:hypothetical protein SAMN02745166_02229 [Prosthecobacter debontii]|uniref:Uncharacterized protein n=1 Tax=Prosthecobacter debontii TaxID=48467 RepID=A0A1T4XZC7_9BACT|nr:hypothetical protein SAMN02745166_02229 [Prosthecobacter debontii]